MKVQFVQQTLCAAPLSIEMPKESTDKLISTLHLQDFAGRAGHIISKMYCHKKNVRVVKVNNFYLKKV
jgi:hypothetical protein